MKKILYIGGIATSNPSSGNEQVNLRNIMLLKELFGEHNLKTFFIHDTNNRFLLVLNFLLGFCAGLNHLKTKEIIKLVSQFNYDYVFIGQSVYGLVAKKIKKVNPNTQVIVFFHNAEYQYAKELIKVSGSSRYLYYFAAKKNEKFSILYGDIFIGLNLRDSKLIEKRYNKKFDLVLPTSFKDRCVKMNKLTVSRGNEILFVGVNFFANTEGLFWFIDKVLPYVEIKLTVIGKGMEKFRYLNSRKINVIGTVDFIDEYYYNADCVVIPIFSGGGMKTKTGEALMFGKTIFATVEAFEGYPISGYDIGKTCNNQKDFIDAINEFINSDHLKFNLDSRRLFTEHLTFESSLKKIANLLKIGKNYE